MFFGKKAVSRNTRSGASGDTHSGDTHQEDVLHTDIKGEDGKEIHNDTLRRLRVRFVGEVQGVGFRWTAMGVARDLSLTGWIRNESDGSVIAEVQGPSSRVGSFFSGIREKYRRFPITYTIRTRDDIPPIQKESSFEVRF